MDAKAMVVTDQAREDFAKAFDITVEEQIAAEKWFDTQWIVDQLPSVHGGRLDGKYAQQDEEDRRKWSEEGAAECPACSSA